MGLLRDLYTRIFSKKESTQPVTKHHSPTEYKPVRVVRRNTHKHPLHKYHFGQFSPIKRIK